MASGRKSSGLLLASSWGDYHETGLDTDCAAAASAALAFTVGEATRPAIPLSSWRSCLQLGKSTAFSCLLLPAGTSCLIPLSGVCCGRDNFSKTGPSDFQYSAAAIPPFDTTRD